MSERQCCWPSGQHNYAGTTCTRCGHFRDPMAAVRAAADHDMTQLQKVLAADPRALLRSLTAEAEKAAWALDEEREGDLMRAVQGIVAAADQLDALVRAW